MSTKVVMLLIAVAMIGLFALHTWSDSQAQEGRQRACQDQAEAWAKQGLVAPECH